MKKQLTKISTLALTFLSVAGFSQTGRVQPCNTYAVTEMVLKNDPAARQRYEEGQKAIAEQLANSLNNPAKAAAFEYTVPVVFHVLYECGSAPIADSTIIRALKQVNDDYARNSADTNLVVNPFKMSYINSDIKFMLAKRDPQGNCINGIVRHENAKTHWDQATASLNSVIGNAYWEYTWDPTKYLNVYLVDEIIDANPSPGGGIVVGYTYRPGTAWATGNPHDAIVYTISYLGGTNGNVPKSRSLSHEMGHWLGLAHTFGNTNNPGTTCSDDNISDTPVTKGEFGGCPSSFTTACPQPNPAMAGLNNVQNIMNYSDCPRNFTTGQTNVMRSILGGTVSGRSNLWQPATIISTDVNGSGNCNPIAEFFSTNCSYTLCAGSTLTFKDQSNSSITNIAWAADNGAILTTPNNSITTITFPNVGVSDVSVTVTNAQGTNTKVRTITIMDNTPGVTGPYMESFEVPGLPPNWLVVNPNTDVAEWTQTNLAAYDGVNSYVIAGPQKDAGNSDILQMPIMDVLHNQSNIFQFAYAYRQSSPQHTDVLRIEGSKDCGGTWQTIYSMNANVMANGSGGVSTDDFVPFSNEWKVYTISSHPNWQNYKTSASVLVRFNFIESAQGNGNNMYIDAVNFFSTTGVNELTKSILFNVYPNPTTGEANVNFNLDDAAAIKISVMDIMGREVLPSVEKIYPAGEQTIALNKDNTLAKGIYFVNLTHNGAKMSTKLVID